MRAWSARCAPTAPRTTPARTARDAPSSQYKHRSAHWQRLDRAHDGSCVRNAVGDSSSCHAPESESKNLRLEYCTACSGKKVPFEGDWDIGPRGEKKNNRAPSPCLHGPKHSKRHCRHTCVGKTSPFLLRIRISGVASLVADRRALHHARYVGSCGCGFRCTSIGQPTHTQLRQSRTVNSRTP